MSGAGAAVARAKTTRLGDVFVRSRFGREITEVLEDVARLRIAVFREFPYLYDGTREYELRYLADYARSDEALVVTAESRGEIVGVSTAMPLTLHSDAVVAPLREAGFDPERVYYFGESVLARETRGLGVGHAFFDHREEAARAFGRFDWTAFCAVVRPEDHPRRPSDHVPHDAFWARRGYVRRPDITASFGWKDLDEPESTDKPMVFWTRALPRA